MGAQPIKDRPESLPFMRTMYSADSFKVALNSSAIIQRGVCLLKTVDDETWAHLPSSKQTVFGTTNFTFLDILTKPMYNSFLSYLNLTGTCLGPNPNG